MKRKFKIGITGLAYISFAIALISAKSVNAANINYSFWNLQQPDGTTIKSSQLVSG